MSDHLPGTGDHLRPESVFSLGRNPHLEDLPDFYLVLTGPVTAPASSRDDSRPWLIEGVYLFEAQLLIDRLLAAGRVKIGIATSVKIAEWDAAEVFPRQASPLLRLEPEQRVALALFSGRAPRGVTA